MNRIAQHAEIKEEYGDFLVSELADWSPIGGSICVPSSSGISQQSTTSPPQDSQSILIQPFKISPTDESNLQSPNDGNTCLRDAFVHDEPKLRRIKNNINKNRANTRSRSTINTIKVAASNGSRVQKQKKNQVISSSSNQNASLTQDVNASAGTHSNTTEIEFNQNFAECNDRLNEKRKQSQLTTISGMTNGIGNSGEEHETEGRMKTIFLNCSELNCDTKIRSLYELYYHLRNFHKLAPHRCVECTERFDNISQLDEHIGAIHAQTPRLHLYFNEMTGQFNYNACNAVTKCSNEQFQHNALAGQ